MRILSVTIIPPGGDAQWWRISNIAKILSLEGCEIDVAHYIVKGCKSHKKLSRIDTTENNKNFLTILPPISIPIFHLKMILRQNYDLVYGNTDAGTFFAILGKLAGIPLILDKHGVPEELFLTDGIKISNIHALILGKIMEIISLRYSNKIICVSKNMISYLHDHKGVPLEKMTYVTNGVDLDFFQPEQNEDITIKLKKTLGIENKFIFGYIGRLQGYQGITNLIEAADKIDNENVVLIVVGGATKFKRNNIIIIPEVSREQIPYYYSICNVLILPRPSHIATDVAAPTKFAEYVAMGKPILTTDVGDAADLVRQYQNGIIVENNRPENLAKGMLEFVMLNDDQLINMGKRSRELAEYEFDWRKISKILMSCLQESVN